MSLQHGSAGNPWFLAWIVKVACICKLEQCRQFEYTLCQQIANAAACVEKKNGSDVVEVELMNADVIRP